MLAIVAFGLYFIRMWITAAIDSFSQLSSNPLVEIC